MLRKIQNSFTSGELSPELSARTDFSKYASGCRILKNFILRPFGGAARRSGFRFIAETKHHDKSSRLVEFEFSDTQAYILEFGDQYIRFYMDGGQIQSAGVPYEVASSYLEADLPLLQFCQSADVLYIFHPKYNTRKLTRTGHTAWTLTEVQFEWGPFMDENVDEAIWLTPSGSGVGSYISVTASALVGVFESCHVSASSTRGALWELGGGYIEITEVGSSIQATGLVQATLTNVAASNVWAEGAFSDCNGFPRTGTFNSDRLVIAGTEAEPQRIWGSVIGDYENHQAEEEGEYSEDYAYRHRIGAQKANVIKSILSEKNLLVFTTGSEWSAGLYGEVIAYDDCPRQRESAFGSGNIAPVSVGNETIFLQRQGRTVRSMKYSSEGFGSYIATNLSLLAEHLTEIYPITEMAYQQQPNQVLWCVRSDGILLGLTYMPEHEIVGWHRHETEGSFESCACIPGDEEDELWVICNRTIGASTMRYIERLDPSFKATDTYDAFFVDSGLSYSGTEYRITNASQTDPVVITAVGASNLDTGDVVRITEASGMTELNYNNWTVGATTVTTFELTGASGTEFTAYDSGGIAKVGSSVMTGLSHLIGKTVAILADGAVVDSETVDASGMVSLDEEAATVQAGLAYTADLETLGLDMLLQIGSIQGMIKKITDCMIRVYKSFGAWIGPDEDNLKEIMFWSSDDYLEGAPPGLFTGDKTGEAEFDYSTEGRVFVRQSDPLPLTVLGIITEVEI